jgi:hypothetical protein
MTQIWTFQTRKLREPEVEPKHLGKHDTYHQQAGRPPTLKSATLV